MTGAAPPPSYFRLPGRRRGLATSATLWRADDHLLVAEVRFWNESYRRIYLRDIQAVVIAEDGRWLIGNLLGLTLVLLFGLIVAGTHDGWRVFWAFPAASSVIGWGVHFLRGATCTCEMATPLASVRLPLRRVRQARRTVALLRPLIEEAQGAPPQPRPAPEAAAPGEPPPLTARVAIVEEALARGGEAPPPPAALSAPQRPPAIVRAGTMRAHAVLCACLVFDAMVTAYQWPRGNPLIDTIGALAFLACVVAAIWALVAQAGTDLGPGFTTFAGSALGAQVVLFFVGWIVVFAALVRRAATQTLQPDFTGRTLLSGGLERIGPWEIAVDSILALWGLVLLLRRRRSRESAWIDLTT
jgi:hypothetical protein